MQFTAVRITDGHGRRNDLGPFCMTLTLFFASSSVSRKVGDADESELVIGRIR